MDSLMLPLLFIASIGMAILYNLGTNVFAGEISYITMALAAVLQLGVTMDYSIFLWHSYNEQLTLQSDHKEAMAGGHPQHLYLRHRQLCHHHRRLHRPVLHVLHAGP